MKALFDHPWPFALAHGGFQIQIEQTKQALEKRGVEVEHLRWWDSGQTGDLIHYFGRPTGTYIDFAHAKGMAVVVAELHGALGARSDGQRHMQRRLMDLSRLALPRSFTEKLAWEAYRKADAFVALTEWEAHLMRTIFRADPARIHVVANGVEDVFFQPHLGGDYLVCTAAIHPRKRVLELAQAAAAARVPVWIIGRPYAESDPYYQRFLECQRKNPDWVRYEGAISDRARLAEIYRGARGFALLSREETLSLSALEAAASGCPLLLSDLPWAREVFGAQATYVRVEAKVAPLANALAAFYRQAPALPATFRPLSWDQVAEKMEACYRAAIASSTARVRSATSR